MSEKTLLIISISYLDKDPRVLRQINWLKDTYKITTIGNSPSSIDEVEHYNYEEIRTSLLEKVIRVSNLLVKNYEAFYWRKEKRQIVEKLKNRTFHTIIANDFDTLPIAFELAKPETKIVFDAHEYAPQHFEDQWQWRLLVQPIAIDICQKFIPKVNKASTVCQSLAEKYEKKFGKKFQIITNAPDFVKISPSIIDSRKIKLIYHGVASESRETYKQIEMMDFLDERFELNLMVMGQEDYIKYLKKKAESVGKINFIEPVKTKEIPYFTNQFDIGLFLLPPTNTNYQYALPNKFFEYIQARLAIAIGPSIEMKKIVEKYDLGVIADDFSPKSMARVIEKLSAEKIGYYKNQSHKYAYELSADINKEKFLELVDE